MAAGRDASFLWTLLKSEFLLINTAQGAFYLEWMPVSWAFPAHMAPPWAGLGWAGCLQDWQKIAGAILGPWPPDISTPGPDLKVPPKNLVELHNPVESQPPTLQLLRFQTGAAHQSQTVGRCMEKGGVECVH